MKKYFTSQDARNLITAYGLAIFPVHGIADGNCTCGDANCTNKGKHPATPDGFKSATNDIDQLLALWAARKHLNVGIVTGAKSNIFVIDIDSAEGEKNLRDLGKLPDTLSVTTGKGRHLYFKHPGEPVITKRGILEGVDVRGDGGYVCGPGSNHISGSRYEWINPIEVIQEAPDFLLDLVVVSRIKPVRSAPVLNIVSNSSRLNIDGGWSVDDIKDHLSHINPDLGYDEWIKVGMALHEEGLSFSLWDDWSKTGSKYDGTTGQHWKSFHKGGGVSYGTVVAYAKAGGWERQSVNVKPNIIIPNLEPVNSSVGIPTTARAKQPEFDPKTGEVVENKETKGARRKLPLIYADDAKSILDTSDFIENFLCENQFSVIYGESNCGKTFFMLDLAMHVALGKSWRGREVEQGGVIYAALEGGYNTQNRIVAFKQHYNLTGTIPLAIIPSSVNLLDPEGDINSLVEAIWEAKERIGNIKLIIIDTLSRALHGGDENSSMDMGQLIINADAIRSVTGAHISFVHHCGKDAVKGARGHSSLRAAVDTEIEISRDDEFSPSKIKTAKQREMPMAEDMFFTLQSIELGQNQRNKPVTSCVVLEADGVVSTKSAKLTAIQEFVYEAILQAIDEHGEMRSIHKDMPIVKAVSYDAFYEVLYKRGYKNLMDKEGKVTEKQIKSSTQSARVSLRKHNKIGFEENWIWLIKNDYE